MSRYRRAIAYVIRERKLLGACLPLQPFIDRPTRITSEINSRCTSLADPYKWKTPVCSIRSEFKTITLNVLIISHTRSLLHFRSVSFYMSFFFSPFLLFFGDFLQSDTFQNPLNVCILSENSFDSMMCLCLSESFKLFILTIYWNVLLMNLFRN